MWYFSWVLGLGLTVSFAILNAMWLEARGERPDTGDDASASEERRHAFRSDSDGV